jgi:hypothetical protein
MSRKKFGLLIDVKEDLSLVMVLGSIHQAIDQYEQHGNSLVGREFHITLTDFLDTANAAATRGSITLLFGGSPPETIVKGVSVIQSHSLAIEDALFEALNRKFSIQE